MLSFIFILQDKSYTSLLFLDWLRGAELREDPGAFPVNRELDIYAWTLPNGMQKSSQSGKDG